MEKNIPIYTRLLGLSDLPILVELYKSHNTHMGVRREHYHEVLTDSSLEEQFLNPNFHTKVLFGTFLEGQLVLSMGISYWSGVPSCTFLRFASLKGSFPARSLRNIFRSLYGECLNHLEASGYNRFYMITSVKHLEALAYLGATWEPFRLKYVMAVEEVIPSNMRSKYENFWSLMAQKTWPIPLVVRSGTLLNKHRQFDTSIVSEKAIKFWTAAEPNKNPYS